MIPIVRPVQAFTYDDNEPLLLVLISYRTEDEYSGLFNQSISVYGRFQDTINNSQYMLAAMSRSSYEQVHLSVENTKIITEDLNIGDYYILKGEVSEVISIPNVVETLQLDSETLLLKADKEFSMTGVVPLRDFAVSPPIVTVAMDPTPESIPVHTPAEYRLVMLVILVTLVALIVFLIFYRMKRKKQDDVSSYF